MNPRRLNSASRVDGAAQVVGVARLNGWGIRFDLYSKCNGCGVTDLIPSAREHAFGVLYRVPYRMVVAPRGQRSRMDRVEGAGLGARGNYKRIRILVLSDGEQIEARTYVGTAAGRRRFLSRPEEDRRVSNAYFRQLLIGAKRFRFPFSYVAYLRRKAGQ